MAVLTFFAFFTLTFISYQDFKERQVYWFLFLLLALFLGWLHFNHSITAQIFLYYTLLNLILVTLIVVLLYSIVRFILNKKFLNYSLGLGDILFFYAFAFGFPTLTFSILFANSLVLSLLIFMLFKKRFRQKTIPLAGIMSLFILSVLSISLFIQQPLLYRN